MENLNEFDMDLDYSRLLNRIRVTIHKQNEYQYSPLPEYKDRFHKIDAHAIFAVALFFSSSNALKRGDVVLASIGQYYSIYHICFALVALDFGIDGDKLAKMKHSQLENFIKRLIDRKVVSWELLELFLDLKNGREYFNYLNVDDGFEKFQLLRQGYASNFACFGKVKYTKLSKHAKSPLEIIIRQFFFTLNQIEADLRSNRLTDNERPILFKSIRRSTHYDYYGEDLLMDFFPEEVLNEIEEFLENYEASKFDFL